MGEIFLQLLCSSGAFGRYPTLISHLDIVKYAPLLPVDGLEVMCYADWTPQIEQVATDLLFTGQQFPALHVEKSVGPLLISADATERAHAWEWLRACLHLGQLLGTRVAVFHLWGLPGSDEHIEDNLSVLGDCVQLAEEYGLILAVETVPCVKRTPLDLIQLVLERNERCAVALDSEFLAMYNQIERAFASDWLWSGGRVQHVHLKDYDGRSYDRDNYRRYLHPGEGDIDFLGFFANLKARGYSGNLSLEASVVHPDGTRDMPKLQRSLENLQKLIQQVFV